MAGLTQKLRQDYFLLYESCLVRPARKAAVDQVARRLGASRPRYEKVAKALRMPWYVVAVIHSLEAGGDFTRHLHNGDPLGARTTHLPAGRPKTGAPPFTWEASAIDALTYRGFGKWTDWSIPGTLYKLEGYNGWGYRDHHPKVHSPYLWSFSNHYTRGKYVADGRFSPTAISQQCGAAVLLRRLQAGGKAAVQAGPRVLQLANPHMTGPDIEELQRLLAKNAFGSFDAGKPDGEYGELTAGAVERAKWELGYPQNAVNSVFGPQVKTILAGRKPLPDPFKRRRMKRLGQARSEQGIRKRIVNWALWGCKNSGQIGYSQNGSVRLSALERPGALPLATDCSAFATLCYCWARAPNPNGRGVYDARQPAYTGSMLDRCRRIPKRTAQPGDLVVWVPPSRGHHVCVVVAAGADPMLVSHGDETGPKRLRFSAEDGYQRRHGHGNAVFLSAF
ncbi:MAG TPA: peptidoglycan-binding protein [Gaiellaceae bacterium]|nr:peptidoglycan-binding protein [Gaiellaceae bacterium]